MAHAYYHARSSARRFGGKWEDYILYHEWMDHTKAHIADARHRLVLHNSWGIFLAEQVHGRTFIRASDGKEMPLRPILEQHVIEDMGMIPTLEQALSQHGITKAEPWMYRKAQPLSQREQREETMVDDDSNKTHEGAVDHPSTGVPEVGRLDNRA